MRLDKYICDCTGLTRSQAGKLIRQRAIVVNGAIAKQAAMKLSAGDEVQLDGEVISPIGLRYLVMNKPEGYVCGLDDPHHAAVFTLLDEPAVEKIHSVGRLDVDTTGLLLLTDDGKWSHRISSPRHHIAKTYRVWTADAISEDAAARFAEGVVLRDEPTATKPAQLELVGSHEALLTIHEGRYHQVKRMFAALGNRVERLHRERIGQLQLPTDLELGEYRPLTDAELAAVFIGND
ncbi:16S rRNA pseudouridine(516) synthase RsuA [Pseudidiomarina mangrovi]|uniref:16S rRNA pseudouridine(516) synthase RsuA n=1 Tax=Pseudidiomarina mangrovi TaxID=2487133 RepID=UPI000FCB4125|nr:16S rRNA pseudouridine(516) synthase RsuA [Pseudidiomarina mangrovi]